MIELGIEEKTYTLNLGPQHPSTHGVLRVVLEMDGEYITKAEPVIGYGHRGHEHMAENRNYQQFLPNMGRVDYLHALAYNQGYCMAVEKLLGLTVPERGEFIRVILSELNRISSHLVWIGAYLLDLGAFTPSSMPSMTGKISWTCWTGSPVPASLTASTASAGCPGTSTRSSSPAPGPLSSACAAASGITSRW